MLNLAHVMTAEDRVRGLDAARQISCTSSVHTIFCKAEDFVRLIYEHNDLCANGLPIIGNVLFDGFCGKNRMNSLRLPEVEIVGFLTFSDMVFQGSLDLSLVTLRGSLELLNTSVHKDLIVPSNYDQITLINENSSVHGRRLKVISF
jgi:hypothetical protein